MDIIETIKGLQNGENAEQVTAVLDEVNRLTEANKDLDTRIRALQDQNQRLFLRITGDPADDHEPEEPKELTREEVFEQFRKAVLPDVTT